jgi:DnaJ-class molecular chaperone
MSDNFYEILEVQETSSIDEIKKSYRRLSMIYHPDKNKSSPDATAKFQKISEAYETLGDADKKKEYDAMRNNPFAKMMNGQQGGKNPMEDLFANLFGGMPFGHMQSFGPGQGTPFGHMQSFGPGQNMFEQGSPFGANVRIFHNGIPVNNQGFVQGLQKPTPIIKNLIISIDKILTGTTIPVDIERWLIQDGNKVFENEIVYVTVPKGIDEGEIIVLREKGNIVREDCKGDIKLFIKVENNTEFERNGLDLIYEKTISIKEALCGFTFELKYITGKVYTINNTSGNIISHGYKKIIPNMGFSREQHNGNLIIIFNIKFPEKLTEEVMDQLKKVDF